MREVIQFPRASVRLGTRPKAELDGERARQIRGAIDKRKPLRAPDQVRVAENLWTLVKEAKTKHGLRTADICANAGLGHDGDKGKSLDTYTLPTDLVGDDRERRIARLAKKPRKYAELAQSIATGARLDEDEILSRLFEGCDFGRTLLDDPDWDDEPWAELAKSLRRMTSNVIERTSLKDYWRDVHRLPGCFDVRTSEIALSHCPLATTGREPLVKPMLNTIFAYNTTCSDEVSPIPSVPLARRLFAPPAPGTMVLRDPDEEIAADFLLWLEVRLAVGPVRAVDSIGPLLEVRSVLEAMVDGRLLTFDNPFTDGSDTITQIGGDRVVASVRINEEFPLCSDWQAEHSYFGWLEVTPATLSELLKSGLHDDWEPRWLAGCVDRELGLALRDRPLSYFPFGERAFFVETSLYSGSLERDLMAECDKMKELVQRHKINIRNATRQASVDAKSSWQTDQGDGQ